MKLHILSDLHLEFAPYDPTPPGDTPDVTVLAGDIHTGHNGLRWIHDKIKKTPALYILGNHEYYGQTAPSLVEDLKKEAAQTHVHILENEELILHGVRFLGATLWTDFNLFNDPLRAQAAAQLGMTDFRRIRTAPLYSRLRPADTRRWHQRSLNWLCARLSENTLLPTVVITHHAPSLQSVPPQFQQDDLTPAFASHLESIIREFSPHLWIHGHIHTHSDYWIGNTRVLANPRGYPSEHETRFDPNLVVEIS